MPINQRDIRNKVIRYGTKTLGSWLTHSSHKESRSVQMLLAKELLDVPSFSQNGELTTPAQQLLAGIAFTIEANQDRGKGSELRDMLKLDAVVTKGEPAPKFKQLQVIGDQMLGQAIRQNNKTLIALAHLLLTIISQNNLDDHSRIIAINAWLSTLQKLTEPHNPKAGSDNEFINKASQLANKFGANTAILAEYREKVGKEVQRIQQEIQKKSEKNHDEISELSQEVRKLAAQGQVEEAKKLQQAIDQLTQLNGDEKLPKSQTVIGSHLTHVSTAITLAKDQHQLALEIKEREKAVELLSQGNAHYKSPSRERNLNKLQSALQSVAGELKQTQQYIGIPENNTVITARHAKVKSNLSHIKADEEKEKITDMKHDKFLTSKILVTYSTHKESVWSRLSSFVTSLIPSKKSQQAVSLVTHSTKDFIVDEYEKMIREYRLAEAFPAKVKGKPAPWLEILKDPKMLKKMVGSSEYALLNMVIADNIPLKLEDEKNHYKANAYYLLFHAIQAIKDFYLEISKIENPLQRHQALQQLEVMISNFRAIRQKVDYYYNNDKNPDSIPKSTFKFSPFLEKIDQDINAIRSHIRELSAENPFEFDPSKRNSVGNVYLSRATEMKISQKDLELTAGTWRDFLRNPDMFDLSADEYKKYPLFKRAIFPQSLQSKPEKENHKVYSYCLLCSAIESIKEFSLKIHTDFESKKDIQQLNRDITTLDQMVKNLKQLRVRIGKINQQYIPSSQNFSDFLAKVDSAIKGFQENVTALVIIKENFTKQQGDLAENHSQLCQQSPERAREAVHTLEPHLADLLPRTDSPTEASESKMEDTLEQEIADIERMLKKPGFTPPQAILTAFKAIKKSFEDGDEVKGMSTQLWKIKTSVGQLHQLLRIENLLFSKLFKTLDSQAQDNVFEEYKGIVQRFEKPYDNEKADADIKELLGNIKWLMGTRIDQIRSVLAEIISIDGSEKFGKNIVRLKELLKILNEEFSKTSEPDTLATLLEKADSLHKACQSLLESIPNYPKGFYELKDHEQQKYLALQNQITSLSQFFFSSSNVDDEKTIPTFLKDIIHSALAGKDHFMDPVFFSGDREELKQMSETKDIAIRHAHTLTKKYEAATKQVETVIEFFIKKSIEHIKKNGAKDLPLEAQNLVLNKLISSLPADDHQKRSEMEKLIADRNKALEHRQKVIKKIMGFVAGRVFNTSLTDQIKAFLSHKPPETYKLLQGQLGDMLMTLFPNLTLTKDGELDFGKPATNTDLGALLIYFDDHSSGIFKPLIEELLAAELIDRDGLNLVFPDLVESSSAAIVKTLNTVYQKPLFLCEDFLQAVKILRDTPIQQTKENQKVYDEKIKPFLDEYLSDSTLKNIPNPKELVEYINHVFKLAHAAEHIGLPKYNFEKIPVFQYLIRKIVPFQLSHTQKDLPKSKYNSDFFLNQLIAIQVKSGRLIMDLRDEPLLETSPRPLEKAKRPSAGLFGVALSSSSTSPETDMEFDQQLLEEKFVPLSADSKQLAQEEIERRHQGVLEIEAKAQELLELYKIFGGHVSRQQQGIDQIGAHALHARNDTFEGLLALVATDAQKELEEEQQIKEDFNNGLKVFTSSVAIAGLALMGAPAMLTKGLKIVADPGSALESLGLTF